MIFALFYIMQKYEQKSKHPNFIPKLVRAILPALAGSFQTFVKLALQQFFGGEFSHILRHFDAGFVELQQFYLLVATFGA
jgi:hypothetical protein